MAVHVNGKGNENGRDKKKVIRNFDIRLLENKLNEQGAGCCNCRNLFTLQKALIAIVLIITLAAYIFVVVFLKEKLPSDACIGGKRCQNGGTCFYGPNNNNSCVCAHGYEGQLCASVTNNCAHNPCLNGGTCKNDVGSFSCICLDDFGGNICQNLNNCRYSGTCAPAGYPHHCYKCRNGFLKDSEDDTRCKYVTTNTSLIISSPFEMRMVSLDRPNATQIIEKRDNVFDTDYNFRTNSLFWFSFRDNTMYTAPIGQEFAKKSLFQDSTAHVFGVAVDWIYEHLYWVDWGNGQVGVCNFDGTMKKIIFNDGWEAATRPTSIVVNPLNGWMYWNDESKKHVERAGLDGSHRKVILNKNKNVPRGLAVDLMDSRLYWSEGTDPSSIWSSEFDGSDRNLIFSPNANQLASSRFLKIATFDKNVYFIEKFNAAIYKINKCNGTELQMIHKFSGSSYSKLVSIHIFDVAMQPEGENLCSKRIDLCSHFCFPVPSPGNGSVTTTTCACPDGLSLSADKLNCV